MKAYCTVTLEKVSGAEPKPIPSYLRPKQVPVGTRYTWTYTTSTRENAEKRAAKAVVATYADEDILDWRIV